MIYINKAYEQPESHRHAHDFIEIAYVVSGKGIHRLGEKEYAVSKGDLFIINYDIPHEFRSLPNPHEPPLYVHNCVFRPEFLDAALINTRDFSAITRHLLFRSLFPEELEARADIHLLDKDNREIEAVFAKMFREYQIKDAGYLELLRAYLIELLILVFRLCRHQSHLENRLEIQRDQLIQKVIQHMKDHYSEEIKLEELSALAFLSRNYFCKLFKSVIGMTVSEYAQTIRIEEACRLLRESNKKVIDIALEVGYRDIKFFNQVFKRITGKTPGEYRGHLG